MGRPKDAFNSYTTEGEKDGKAIKKCIFCDHCFSKDVSVTRIKAHLGNVKGQGVAPCPKVPPDIKNAAKNAMPSTSSNTLNTIIPRNSEMQQPSPQILQSAAEQPPRLPDCSLQQSNVDPMDVQPNPLLQDTTQQLPPQRSGASGPPPPQNMQLDIPMQQDNAEQFDPLGMGAGDLGRESLTEMTSLSEGDHQFLSTFFNDPQSFMNQMALNDPKPDESCSMQLESLHTVHQLQREQDAPWIDSAHGTSTPQDMLTKPWLEVPEMPPDTLHHNENCSTNGTLASQHPRQQHPREYHNHLPDQELLQGAQGMDPEYNATTPRNLFQGGACPDSLPDSTHQDDMVISQFGHEGLRSQNHMEENLQGDQRIVSLYHDPYTSIDQVLHHMSTDPLPESSDAPRSTSNQPKRKKRKYSKLPIGKKLPEGTLSKGSTFNKKVDEICEFLGDDSVSKIGIYGMRGCGKTTIMKYIHNQLLEGCFMSCSDVIWVHLPRLCTISMLQKCLACALEVTLSPDEDEGGDAWAALLYEKMQKMTYALVLDNVWNEINLIEVGIPEPTRGNGCKLILTTQSLDVCKRMQCECIQLNILPKDEAWDLFVKILNVDQRESPIQDNMEKVVEKCAGLPLAITTVAESMRGAISDHDWGKALNSLSNGDYDFIHMEKEIVKPLKFSYDRLDKPLQKCLLICTLYPEDIQIKKDELIELLINEEIIGIEEGRKSAYDLGQTILDKLERASLLARHTFGYVMHDLIRGMCLNIMGNRFVVSSRSKSPPDLSEYSEDVEKVSLMESEFEEIPAQMVKRSKLSTLLLSENRYLRRISSSFFEGLHRFNLSNTPIEELPSSITNLLSLKALVLRGCRNLRCLPRLAPLKALKQLDLYATAIKEAPEGLEELVNLTYLDLEWTDIEQFSSSILTNLVKLQHLKLPYGSKILMKDLKELKKLELFKANFANWKEFVEYVSNGRHSEYEIEAQLTCVGASCASMKYKISEDKEEGEVRARLQLREDHNTIGENQLSSEVIGQIPSPKIVQSLVVTGLNQGETRENGEQGIFGATVLFPFLNLVTLVVSDLDFTKHLILASSSVVESSSSPKVLPYFQNLQFLKIISCKSLESILVSIANPTKREESNNPISIPKIRKLTLWHLPDLRSIYDGTLICPSIEYIDVRKCPKLKRLPLQVAVPVLHNNNNNNSRQLSSPLSPLSSLKEIEGESKWWESLEWDQPHAKPLLQPYFQPLKRTP